MVVSNGTESGEMANCPPLENMLNSSADNSHCDRFISVFDISDLEFLLFIVRSLLNLLICLLFVFSLVAFIVLFIFRNFGVTSIALQQHRKRSEHNSSAFFFLILSSRRIIFKSSTPSRRFMVDDETSSSVSGTGLKSI